MFTVCIKNYNGEKISKMFIKKAKHKVFDYQPRYYDPSKDEDERRKRKLAFKSNLKYNRNSGKKSLLMLIIMALFVLYLFLYFNGYF